MVHIPGFLAFQFLGSDKVQPWARDESMAVGVGEEAVVVPLKQVQEKKEETEQDQLC